MPIPTNKIEELREKIEEIVAKAKLNIYSNLVAENEIMAILSLAVQEAVAQERKAFGGCLNCYGKGYATQMVHAGNSRHGVWELDPIRFCECDRGKQLEKLITNHKV